MSAPGRPLATDLDGGMDPAVDEMTASTPTSASHRESASLWLWDDAGRFGFPRLGVEAVGGTWETARTVGVCMATPDGRLLVTREDHAAVPVSDDEGRPRVLGAGPLRLTCVEPFRQWRLDLDGDNAPFELHVEARMLVPPWFQGTHDPEGHHVVGEQRFEQLCEVAGRVVVDGTETSFSGGGLRVHRKGGARNDYGDFYGHNWQTARFPSGRAFGFIHYRPRPDGSPKYREGWVLDRGVIEPARVEGTPWMHDDRRSGEDVGFSLHTADREIRLEGKTLVSQVRPPRVTETGTTFPTLFSGIARYRWDHEEALGMIERSALLDPKP